MKAFKLFLRLARENKAGILITLAISALMIFIFYTIPNPDQTDFENQKIKVSYHIENESPLTEHLKLYLSDYVSEETLSLAQLEDAHYFQVVSLSIIIKGDLSEDLKNNQPQIELFSRNADTFVNGPVETAMTTYLNLYQTLIEQGTSESEAISLTNETLQTKTKVELLYHAQSSKYVIFRMMSYLSYLIILSGLMIVVPVMIKMRQKDVLERTMISAYPKKRYFGGLFLSSMLFMIVFTLLLIAIIAILFIKEITLFELGLYSLNTFVYLSVIIALSVLIGILAKNEAISAIFANILGLSQSFLIGIFIPRDLLSPKLVNIARLLPGHYLVNANELIRDNQVSLNGLFKEYVYLFIFLIGFLGALIITNQLKKKNN